MDMSGLTIYFKQDEAAVRAVLAGADMLLKPADPDAAARGLREAVASGRLAEKRVEESARKILAAKYDLGLVKQRTAPLDMIDQLVSSPEALKLADDIARNALTLVRDDARLLQREGGAGLRPDLPVNEQAAARLERAHRPVGVRPEDAVHPAGVEPHGAEAALELVHVVPSEHR
jgi:beta-N-acetylhexosaminidase